jgi:hypothetical protein
MGKKVRPFGMVSALADTAVLPLPPTGVIRFGSVRAVNQAIKAIKRTHSFTE